MAAGSGAFDFAAGAKLVELEVYARAPGHAHALHLQVPSNPDLAPLVDAASALREQLLSDAPAIASRRRCTSVARRAAGTASPSRRRRPSRARWPRRRRCRTVRASRRVLLVCPASRHSRSREWRSLCVVPRRVAPAARGERAVTVELPAHHLVTHGVLVGMTGSGKTGLLTVLLEKALQSGARAEVRRARGGGRAVERALLGLLAAPIRNARSAFLARML